MKNLLRIVFTLTLLLTVVGVEAQQRKAQSREYGEKATRRSAMADGLNLTGEQKTKMKSLRLELQKEILPIKNEIGENSARLRSLSTLDNVDLKAINKIIDANGVLKANIAKLSMANRQQARKMLNEEQRIVFDTQKFHKRQLYKQRTRAMRRPNDKNKIRLKEEGKPKR